MRHHLSKEETVETREELHKELAKLMVERQKAWEDMGKLLPPVARVSEGEQLVSYIPTEESLTEYDEAERRCRNAVDRIKGILEKLSKLSKL